MRTLYALALTVLCAMRAVGHHAEAEFAHNQLTSATGTIEEYLWVNPHALIFLQVTSASGRSDVTSFQGGSIKVMKRAGWTSNSLKPGDKVTIEYHPRRDKQPGGMFVTATLADGKKLTWQPTMP